MHREPIRVWGLPIAPLSRVETVEAVAELIEAGGSAYFITANTHYVMLSHGDPRLMAVNGSSAFLVADGAPLVWASRWRRTPLPERVAGSDLIFDLCALSASRGYRPFLLGGPPGVAEQAAERLEHLYPGLRIAGTACPPFRPLDAAEHAELIETIRQARPDLLFVAFGQPKGELWISEHFRALGVPACVQVGASLDFVAGRVRRAPRWIQKIGMEWSYRLALEPRRLAPRYARNALFLLRMAAGDLRRGRRPEPPSEPGPGPGPIADPPSSTTALDAPTGVSFKPNR